MRKDVMKYHNPADIKFYEIVLCRKREMIDYTKSNTIRLHDEWWRAPVVTSLCNANVNH